MENTVFAGELYDFFKQHDKHDFYAGLGQEGSITHIQKLLINLYPVRDMIKEVEEISDSLDDHRYYVDEVKPLLCDLREMEKNLEANERRRMVSTTGYEVKCALHVGDKEILFAEDKKAENGKCYFVGNYGSNELFGEYSECRISNDYLGALQDFTGRVSGQIKKMKDEIKQSKPCELFTAEHCYKNDLSQSIDGKIVAIKAEIFRPEYRRGEHQLVLVDGGFGAEGGARGQAVFCYQLKDGKHTRFERFQVQGEVRPQFLPLWAKEKAADIRDKKEAEQQRKPKDKGGR